MCPKYRRCLKDRTSSGLVKLHLASVGWGESPSWGGGRGGDVPCSIRPALPLLPFWQLWAMGVAENRLEELPEAPQRLEEQNTNGKELVLFSFYFKPNTRILRDLIHGV